MYFLRFEDKEIPFEGAWENPEYLAFLGRIQADREKAEDKRNERLTLIATLVGVVIAFAAAGAAFWSGYEAHQARIQDERPFVGLDITSFARTTENRPKYFDGTPLPDSVVGPPIVSSVIGYGKTPAHNIKLQCAITLYDWKQVSWSQTDTRPYKDLPYLIPGRSEVFMCGVQIPPNARSTTPAKGFVIRALAEYEDGEHRTYRTPVCKEVFMRGEQVTSIDTCSDDYGMPSMR